MSVKVTWIARLATAVVALAAIPASAQTEENQSFELERLQLNPSGQGALTVWDGSLMTPGSFRAAAAGQYEYAPLVLHRPDGFPFGILVKERATIHVAFAYAPIEWVEIDGQVPAVFFSNGSAVAGLPVPRGKVVGTPWLSARAAILRPGMNLPFSLRLGGELGVGIPVGRRDLYTNPGGVMFAPKLAAGVTVGNIDAALELNALVRPAASLESFSGSTFDRASNTWGLAVMLNTGGTGARVEVNGRYARNFFSPGWGAEILGGLRMPFSAHGPELFVEAGPGVGNLIGQPTFRVYAGLAFGGSQKALGGAGSPGMTTESPTLPLPPPKAPEASPETMTPAAPAPAPAPPAPAPAPAPEAQPAPAPGAPAPAAPESAPKP